MVLLANPTLDQLRRLKEQNLTELFQEFTDSDGNPIHSRVFGVGIGPATAGTGTSVEIETTGANTIVLLIDVVGFDSTFVPAEIQGTDADNTSISVIPALVPSGTFAPAPAATDTETAPGGTQATDLDEEIRRAENPNAPSVRLIINDTSERSRLMAGAHISISFNRLKSEKRSPFGGLCKPQDGMLSAGGTLGCIARTNDTNQIVGLTCHHVVVPPGSVIATTKDRQGNELAGTDVLGDFRVVKKGDDFVLQMRPTGTTSFTDAPTQRVWKLKNGRRSDSFIVGQPSPGDCCELERDEFGRLLRSTYTPQVDAAAVVLKESQTENCLLPLFISTDLTDYRAEMIGRGGSDSAADAIHITGAIPSDLTLEQLQETFTKPDKSTGHRLSYLVRKYGATTGFTSGLVRCIELTRNPNRPEESGAPPAKSGPCLTVTASTPDDHIWVIPYNEQTKTVAEVFSVGGDSGAAVLNASGQVVGILARGIGWYQENQALFDTIGPGWGGSLCKISAITSALNLSVIPFNAGNVTRTVPNGNETFPTASGAVAMVPPEYQKAWRSPWVAAARRLLPTVRRLVNHNRRVTVAWHRNKGPSLAWGLIHAFDGHNQPVPAEVDGVSSVELFTRFLDVLVTECDGPTREEIDALRPLLLKLPGATAPQIVHTLENS